MLRSSRRQYVRPDRKAERMSTAGQFEPADDPAPALPHPPGFRCRRGLNWVMLGLTYASYYMCRYNLAIAAPRIMDQFGFSNANFGKVNSTRHLAYAFGQLVNGLFADR